MNLMNRNKDAAPKTEPDLGPLREYVASLAGPVDRHDEAERAAECLEQSEALRESVAGTVETAQAELAAIEAEAARAINSARAKLQDARMYAQSVERQAAAIEDKGRAYASAANLAGQAMEVWGSAGKLAAERTERLTDAAALQERLDDLAARQRAALAALDAAKSAVDVEGAGAAQSTLSGIEAVVPGLRQQCDTAAARARAIGGEGDGGEYDKVLARVAALLAQRDQALDSAEPDRVEARRAANPAAALLEDLGNLPPAAREQVLASWSGAQRQPEVSSQVQGSATGGRTAVIRRNG